MFYQLVRDMSKVFMSQNIIRRGVECCMRNFKPRLALILMTISGVEVITCNDAANLLPNENAVTTMKEIEETSTLRKCLEKDIDRKRFLSIVSA